MKVVYILHDTDEFGGANRSFLSLLYGLMGRGVVPMVVVPNRRGIYHLLEKQGIEVLVLDYRFNLYPYDKSLKDYILWLPRLVARRYLNAKAARLLAERIGDFDLVHTNVSVIDIGARAAKIRSIPHIYHFREYADLDFGMKYYPSSKSFHKLVTNSICITKDVQKHHHLRGNSEVIYDTVINGNPLLPSDPLNEKEYILFAGRLEKTKGIEDLLEAYSKSQKILPLWVAGAPLDESYMARLKSLVHQEGIADNVLFLGPCSNVQQLMSDARATIVPSYNEGFGRILPEAMLVKCLTIGRDTKGTKEQYDNGVELTGDEIGLRFNTTAELTSLIDKVCMTEKTEWNSYVERANKTVNLLYTQDVCSTNVVNFYRRILNDKQ